MNISPVNHSTSSLHAQTQTQRIQSAPAKTATTKPSVATETQKAATAPAVDAKPKTYASYNPAGQATQVSSASTSQHFDAQA